MKIFYLLFLVIVLFISNACAQSFKYRKTVFEWNEKPVNPVAVEEQFKNSDAVILDEKCIYNEGGNKVPSYYLLNFAANYAFYDESTKGKTPIIQKHVRIKYLTQNGINKYSGFILPESFDTQNDLYSVRASMQDSVHRPFGE